MVRCTYHDPHGDPPPIPAGSFSSTDRVPKDLSLSQFIPDIAFLGTAVLYLLVWFVGRRQNASMAKKWSVSGYWVYISVSMRLTGNGSVCSLGCGRSGASLELFNQ